MPVGRVALLGAARPACALGPHGPDGPDGPDGQSVRTVPRR